MSRLFTYGLILLAVIVVLATVGTVIFQWVWSWVIPDVFAGAVKHGILPASLTFWQAFKLDLLLCLIVGSGRISASSSK